MQRFAHARRGAAFLSRRPTPEACAKIADASGHTPAHEHEGLSFTLSSIFLYGRIPVFSHSVRKQSACFPLSYGRIRSSWLYCCKESFCFTAESEEKTFASVRSILFCTAIMGEFFFVSVKSRISCAFPTATFIHLQIIAVKPHGHKQNYHWLSMVKTIGNALDCTIGIIRTKDSTVMVIPRDWS